MTRDIVGELCVTLAVILLTYSTSPCPHMLEDVISEELKVYLMESI